MCERMFQSLQTQQPSYFNAKAQSGARQCRVQQRNCYTIPVLIKMDVELYHALLNAVAFPFLLITVALLSLYSPWKELFRIVNRKLTALPGLFTVIPPLPTKNISKLVHWEKSWILKTTEFFIIIDYSLQV